MAADFNKMAYLLQRLAEGVAAHDRENPEHHTWGIGMAHFDIERLGLEEGEEILPGIVLQGDGGGTGQFRVLCDGDHDSELEEAEEEVIEAVSSDERELEIARPVSPGRGDDEPPPPLRPPF